MTAGKNAEPGSRAYLNRLETKGEGKNKIYDTPQGNLERENNKQFNPIISNAIWTPLSESPIIWFKEQLINFSERFWFVFYIRNLSLLRSMSKNSESS